MIVVQEEINTLFFSNSCEKRELCKVCVNITRFVDEKVVNKKFHWQLMLMLRNLLKLDQTYYLDTISYNKSSSYNFSTLREEKV